MFAESSKAFIFQKFAVKLYFGLSLHIFQHGSSLSFENVCVSWCMRQTRFSSAAFVSQSKSTELCNSAAVVRPQSKFTELCSSAAVVSQSKSTEAWRRHLIMTCDIFGTKQTNTLTLCYLLGKTFKPAHSSATLESLKSTRSTKLLEKLLT